jgi:hypothetical protein
VRSLTLDKLDPLLINIVKSIGNIRSNQFYEFRVPPNVQRPSATAKLPEKEEWYVGIRSQMEMHR